MGQEALAAVAAAAEEAAVNQPTAAEIEYAAAVARGDVIEPPKEEAVDPAILAEIAKEGDEALLNQPAIEEKKDDGNIPRARFNEVNEENKRLREQLEALARNKEVPVETQLPEQKIDDPREKLKDLRRQQKELEVEGDLDSAIALGDQIDELILEIATGRAKTSLQQENQTTRLLSSLEEVAAKAYESYPFLDINSDSCDPDAVVAVKSRRDELIAGGKSPIEALQTAVNEKGPKFAKLLGIQSESGLTADQIRAAREKEARERAANASLNQPAELPSKSEKNSFAINVNSLSPAQIKAMPEEEKARLRGDTL